jgi:oligopeptide transport system ATP-binding protein
MSEPLLEIQDLSVEFATAAGTVRAVQSLNLSLFRGETLAVLGESGSGKSVSAAAVMGLLECPPGRISSGRVLFDGQDLLTLSTNERRQFNGKRLGMVFQDALASLNPVYTVGWQIAEVLRVHGDHTRRSAREQAVELLRRVGIPDSGRRAASYPHQLSGGQRQRVMIAMGIALGPDILIADEPTTALDVTIQAQIIDLLDELKRDVGMSLILITHDLGLVADTAARVAVMYAGRVVESADVGAIFDAPAHPYTAGLIDSIPGGRGTRGSLRPIPGTPPDLARIPTGCPFHPRCRVAVARCREDIPALLPIAPGRFAACHRHVEMLDGLY